jgi:hypothetical protein
VSARSRRYTLLDSRGVFNQLDHALIIKRKWDGRAAKAEKGGYAYVSRPTASAPRTSSWSRTMLSRPWWPGFWPEIAREPVPARSPRNITLTAFRPNAAGAGIQ